MRTYTITARWFGVSLTGFLETVDIVEVNEKHYCICNRNVKNNRLEYEWNNFILKFNGNTIAEIVMSKDPYNVLEIINKREPDWVSEDPVCECGGDSLYGKKNGLHSAWCPKYEDV